MTTDDAENRITIRKAETADDYRACQEAQRRAWGLADERDLVPLATMVGAQRHGGLMLGAFLPGGEAVGLSFAFLGRVEGRPCLYSQLTGVVPGYQGHGVGRRLKDAQRAFAGAEGLPCMAWAFDPLQAGNARFNLEKLGATAGRYVVDMYGRRTDALNAGTPTDRLIAVWETDPAAARRPNPALDLDRLPRLIASGPAFAGLAEVDPPGYLVDVPAAVARLRADDPGAALRWVLAVRVALTSAFDRGYRATGFRTEEAAGGRRGEYVLTRAAD